MEFLDFIIMLMVILCTTWIIIHVYNNYRKMKPLKNADDQISWIFAGGKLLP